MNRIEGRLPLVSVIIPYYSQGAYIAETVASVRSQTYPYIELIVVDDGSAKDQEKALKAIEGLVVYRIANAGCAAARNYGFQQSSGEYLVFLDADDVLHKRAIEDNLQALSAHPEASLAFGAVEVIGPDGQTLVPSRMGFPRRNYFFWLLETNPIWSPGATMVRRAAFEDANGFRVVRHFQTDDYEFYLHLAKCGTFCQHDACVLRYRRHDGNMSGDRVRMLHATIESLDRFAAEHELDRFERVQLWHGKKRWQHEFSDSKGLLSKLKSFYFRSVMLWNIDLVYLLHIAASKIHPKMWLRADANDLRFADSRRRNRDAAVRQ